MSDPTQSILCGDVRTVLATLPDQSVHCVVTSPPYWALRDYGVEGQLGLEATPEEYVANMVAVFREVWRVLRDDGTLWLNIGDSFAGSGRGGYAGGKGTLQGSVDGQDQSRIAKGSQLRAGKHERARASGAVGRAWVPPPEGLKQKDLVGIPWMLAFAMRADGWYLRSEVIWHKRSPMPESVRDRPTKSHEQLFLLTKAPRYFYDLIGSQEVAITANTRYAGRGTNGLKTQASDNKFVKGNDRFAKHTNGLVSRRNMRSVWSLSSYALKAAHFAAYPPELVRRCLSAGVSEKGCCPKCGKCWERIVEKRRVPTRTGERSKVRVPSGWDTSDGSHSVFGHNSSERHPKIVGRASQHENSPYQNQSGSVVGNRDPQRHVTETVTVGWKPGCECDPLADGASESLNGGYLPVPCTVLDPFHGAGTTMKVCERLSLSYVGIELNPEYIELSRARPSVVFPHEKKKGGKSRRRSGEKNQRLLFKV